MSTELPEEREQSGEFKVQHLVFSCQWILCEARAES